MLFKTIYNSKVGKLFILSDEKYILGIWFENQKYFGSKYNLSEALNIENDPIKKAKQWFEMYFSGKNPEKIVVPIKLNCSKFQINVLNELSTIKYGELISYKQLSDLCQKNEQEIRNKSRAIANAVGHNPISIIIPCHRVIGSNGSLTGYAGGIDIKAKLLEIENSI